MPPTPSLPTASTEELPDRWDIAEMLAILDEAYGRPPHRPHGDALSELVLALLSQHTSDHNSGRAFHRLIERFPDWDSVIEAPTSEVEDAIRPGGLAPTKAPRLQALLAEVRDRVPDFDIDFLEAMPIEEAKAWLRSLPGVGHKSAGVTLMFALGRPAMPVDTHVGRVAKRLGLTPERANPDRQAELIEEMLEDEQMLPFHVDLIQHGRRTCHARNPECEPCPLLAHCPRVGL
ncbi:MAG: endonuclease III [Chloroflexi bacterium]|nr:endonuclease III [Chloroflexota bacterium]MYE31869.1 endonuclease III [Chloroflexota bacterium]